MLCTMLEPCKVECDVFAEVVLNCIQRLVEGFHEGSYEEVWNRKLVLPFVAVTPMFYWNPIFNGQMITLGVCAVFGF